MNHRKDITMSFSTVLKHLRRKNDMTQEDLADALGLTPQAVSRWETDAAFPDSSVIKKLAYLFDVTTDYLLEVDPARMQDNIRELIKAANKAEPEKAAEMLRAALVDYPRNKTIMAALSRCLYYRIYSYMDDHSDRKAKKILEEALTLTEFLYENGHEDIYTLLGMYRDAGQTERGKELLKKLPGYDNVRQEMVIQLADGEEKIRLMQENAYTLLTKLNWQVYMLSLEDETFSREQRIAMLEQMYEANRALMPDDRECFRNWQPTHIPWQLAKHYSLLGNADTAIHWLEVMRRSCTLENDRFRLKSPAFAGLELTRNGSWGTDWMLDVMGDDYFDNIRNDPRFAELYDELKNET
ncbi:MAG: helix-turn-helix transcriptional regulator [Ruminococcaceae bacterium]|nr:helix-turn-helix transcriptional regulator [Oscillospiraceae bacterium]